MKKESKNKRKKILFVCTGNTCRSPMAEALLKSMIKERKIKWWGVSSRGIRADVGGTMSANSKLALQEVGVSAEGFSPKQLTQSVMEKAFLVVTMTVEQKQMLEACGNVVCVRDLCGFDVPDPYGAGIEVYRRTRDALIVTCRKIIDNYILKDNI